MFTISSNKDSERLYFIMKNRYKHNSNNELLHYKNHDKFIYPIITCDAVHEYFDTENGSIP